MDDALAELEKWNRKHYRFTVGCGGNVQPGDGVFVELVAAGRKVLVDEYDCPQRDEDGLPAATMADIIREALRRWHADANPKWFRLLWYQPVADPVFFGDQWGGVLAGVTVRSLMIELVAPDEADAVRQVREAYTTAGKTPPEKVCVWEKRSADAVLKEAKERGLV